MTRQPASSPDRTALARVGHDVHARLAADPGAWQLPADGADIWAIANFLDADECGRFIAMVDAVAEPSAVYDAYGRGAYRTSYSGNVDPADPLVRTITRRLDDLLGMEPAWGETVQGQRYTVGQEFQSHCDWFHVGEPYWPEQEQRGGQRSWTAMIYLNDVEAGGMTEFPLLGVGIPPQKGSLLAWNNARPDGTPNPKTLHRAHPVEQGVKYVITKWYRTRPWS